MFELIATVQRLAAAPSAGRDDFALHVGEIIGAVRDQLAVRPEEIAQRAVDLPPRVEWLAESAHGCLDQTPNRGHVGIRGEAETGRRIAGDRGIEEWRTGKQGEIDRRDGRRIVARREGALEPEYVVPASKF